MSNSDHLGSRSLLRNPTSRFWAPVSEACLGDSSVEDHPKHTRNQRVGSHLASRGGRSHWVTALRGVPGGYHGRAQ